MSRGTELDSHGLTRCQSLYRFNYHHFIDENMEAERLQVICPKLYIKLMKANRVKGTVLKVKWETV